MVSPGSPRYASEQMENSVGYRRKASVAEEIEEVLNELDRDQTDEDLATLDDDDSDEDGDDSEYDNSGSWDEEDGDGWDDDDSDWDGWGDSNLETFGGTGMMGSARSGVDGVEVTFTILAYNSSNGAREAADMLATLVASGAITDNLQAQVQGLDTVVSGTFVAAEPLRLPCLRLHVSVSVCVLRQFETCLRLLSPHSFPGSACVRASYSQGASCPR